MSSLLLCGRNHALCVRIGSMPNAAPSYDSSLSRKSIGVVIRETTTCLSRPGSTVRAR